MTNTSLKVPTFFDYANTSRDEYRLNEERRKVQITARGRALLILAFEWAQRALLKRQGSASDVQVLDLAKHYLTVAATRTYATTASSVLHVLERQSFQTNIRMTGERKGCDKNTVLTLSMLAASGYVPGRSGLAGLIEWAQWQNTTGQSLSTTTYGGLVAAVVYAMEPDKFPSFDAFADQFDRVTKEPIRTFEEFVIALDATPANETVEEPAAPSPVSVSNDNAGNTSCANDEATADVERPTISWPLFIAAVVAGVALIAYLIILAK